MNPSLPEPNDDEWPVISVYTRAEALADGVLVDVTSSAREAGFRYPTAITQTLSAALVSEGSEGVPGQSFSGRLWDVLWLARLAAARSAQDRITFQVLLAQADPHSADCVAYQEITLSAVCSPGDLGEPVITIGFPSDF